MTVPLELALRETSRGLRLCYFPVRELDALREGEMAIHATTVEHANHLLAEAAKYSDLLDIHLEVSTPEDHSFILDIRGNPLFYHPRTGELSFAGTQAHLEPGQKDLTLRVLVDCSVTEVFANGGEAAFASMTISAECSPIQLEGYTWVKELKVSRLKSIWG